jgi:concentrative nucleoside transporter, CNT family
MNTSPTQSSEPIPPTLPVSVPLPPTPFSWRLGIAAAIIALGGGAYLLQPLIGTRGQALAGVLCFFGIVAVFSANLRAVNWQTIGWGIGLQILLAIMVLKVPIVYKGLEYVGHGVKQFIGFSDKGASFVFGNLYDPRPPGYLKEDLPITATRITGMTGSPLGPGIYSTLALIGAKAMEGQETVQGGTWSRLFKYKALDKDGKEVMHDGYLFQFAFVALPPILFVSAFFTVLYHFGILQWCVRLMAKVMVHLMGTSGAETLSVSANVFMGQTEAPLIVKPYVPRMTNSELFTLMASGMAHISGGMMVVYINYGANPVAVLTTCVMACPCSLYLSKLFLPESSVPETSGSVHTSKEKSPYVNAIDAAASGTSDGLRLALNVAAMLIVFIAFVAMFDGLLSLINPDLKLQTIFGWLFSPAAFLMGVDPQDVEKVGSLLGSKLAINEHYAYLEMKAMKAMTTPAMTARSFTLTAFALTGFANFSSVGIQLGGIGALAPERRHDLARLGGRALFVGFVATLLNAAIAGVLLDPDSSS